MINNSEIAKKWDKNLKYSQVWEDTDILIDALQVKRGGRYLSICSAGDNALSMLAFEPAEVVAVDMNETQLFCAELKKESIRMLNYEEVLMFWGYQKCVDRKLLFNIIRPHLCSECQKYWDSQDERIAEGFATTGGLDAHIKLFSQYLTERYIDEKDIIKFLSMTKEERKDNYNRVFLNHGFHELVKEHFNFENISVTGRDPRYYKYAEDALEEELVKKLYYVLTETNLEDNAYIRYFLMGDYKCVYPFVLRKENFDAIKNNIDCLKLRHGLIEDCLDEKEALFDGLNLSDIFEYMTMEESNILIEKLAVCSNDGTRVAYWNMIVDRIVACKKLCVNYLQNESERLHKVDRAIFYKNFLVHEVKR